MFLLQLGETALHYAAFLHLTPLVTLLLNPKWVDPKWGGNGKFADLTDTVRLMSRFGFVRMCAHRVSCCQLNNDHKTALHYACQNLHLKGKSCVKALIDAGANVNARTAVCLSLTVSLSCSSVAVVQLSLLLCCCVCRKA